MAENEDPAVTRFREYIRINTMQPNPDYEKCTAWLKARGEAVGGEVRVVESAPGKPVVLITFKGTDPRLPSLLLNSHTDVVPVFPEHWKYDPFSATKDENGDIYGRGTQDMKCVGAQYLEAINRMRKQGKTFLRTIHLSFVPEEEIGGVLGMKEFVKMPEFEELNVGFALDEGYANPSEKFSLFYAERTVWLQFNVVPAELSVGFDIRIPPTVDLTEFVGKIAAWCKEAGDDVTFEFKQKLKIPALGFSPMNHTPILLHDHNEFLNEKIFLRGIDIYCTIISALANKPE
ncbi:hypothetical protein HAZT_HAZT004751 [Hyalella azteca]|uniref:Peptidase M20 dimerisation domain-containing protein n=1 Tax=Hyalella azteca TaxID=294128 RepID=A0A6A0GSB6_HYAAZ|nr:hypothetical protein HAZT_HAZT004751 [Hyalella azteca]